MNREPTEGGKGNWAGCYVKRIVSLRCWQSGKMPVPPKMRLLFRGTRDFTPRNDNTGQPLPPILQGRQAVTSNLSLRGAKRRSNLGFLPSTH
jgi:hypothetical protein